jgi:hypothetical protein
MRMKVNRRGFLHLMVPPVLLPGTAFMASAQAANDALFLLVDGIGPATPADRLSAFVDPFLEGEIPFGLILSAPAQSDPHLPAAVAATLRRILTLNPETVEPVLSFPGLADLPPYFQRRAASESLQWLSRVISDATHPLPLTIATDAPSLTSFDALRCLGIRSVLNLGPPPPVSSAGCASLAVCLRGATEIAIDGASNPAERISAALDRPGWAQIVFSLDGIGQESIADVRLRGQRAVDALSLELGRGRRFLALPRDHALWFGEDQSRYVAVLLDGAFDASAAARSNLAARIKALGIPFSETVPADQGAGDLGPEGACLSLAPASRVQTRGIDVTFPAGQHCVTATGPTDSLSPELVASIDLLIVPEAGAEFDGRGLLSRGETPIAKAAILLRDSHRMRDAVLTIGSDDYVKPAALKATLDTLRRLRDDPGTELVDLGGLLQATVTSDKVFELLRGSHRHAVEPPDPEPLSAEDWMADARQAWTFFERFSNASSGLCVDTADVQGDERWLHRELTMWDLGSLIAGVMAAHELGLIPDSSFVARAEQLVRALPVADVGGRLLPSEVISSETGRSLSNDFNACDTGRLLSVLRELDTYPLTLGIAEEKTRRWDLESIVVGRHVHSVVQGKLRDRFRSHCAHYTARAFRDRGFDVASPYEVLGVGSQTDREMLLLQSVGDLGALGAEPLLFEALEMGMSEPSGLLASVLFSAQRDDFERNGTLACVSEAPLNREPWFTYQGLNISAAKEVWMVNAVTQNDRFDTPEFRKRTALVNTKAAYLWAAHRTGGYSTLLTRHVRMRARLDGMGFSPGVFVATGESMPGYADINTNGVILEAIAFIMRGRKPRPS